MLESSFLYADEDTRGELRKMLVPTVLKEQRGNAEEVSSLLDTRECQLIGKKDNASCSSDSETPGTDRITQIWWYLIHISDC